jgi:hypothetical protein
MRAITLEEHFLTSKAFTATDHLCKSDLAPSYHEPNLTGASANGRTTRFDQRNRSRSLEHRLVVLASAPNPDISAVEALKLLLYAR